MKPRGEYKIRKLRLARRRVRYRLTGTTKAGDKIDLRFESPADAEIKKASLIDDDTKSKGRKKYHLTSFLISPEKLSDAERAINLIPPLRNSLGEIICDENGNPKLDPNYTFTDAMQRLIDTGGPIGKGTERLDEIADAYRNHRQHLREDITDNGLPAVSQDTHLHALQEFNRLVRQYSKVELRTLAIAEWRKTESESLTPHAKWSWNVAVCCLLNWAVREKKLTRYEKWLPKRPATEEPAILTLDECQNWVDTAWEFGCYEVEGPRLWGALRSSEARAPGAYIHEDLETFEVPDPTPDYWTKTGHRPVPLSPNVTWTLNVLKAIRELHTGPHYDEVQYSLFRGVAGYPISAQALIAWAKNVYKLSDVPESAVPMILDDFRALFPQKYEIFINDSTRATGGTYHCHACQDPKLTVAFMGNGSKDIAIFRRHYLGRNVPASNVRTFYQIIPTQLHKFKDPSTIPLPGWFLSKSPTITSREIEEARKIASLL